MLDYDDRARPGGARCSIVDRQSVAEVEDESASHPAGFESPVGVGGVVGGVDVRHSERQDAVLGELA